MHARIALQLLHKALLLLSRAQLRMGSSEIKPWVSVIKLLGEFIESPTTEATPAHLALLQTAVLAERQARGLSMPSAACKKLVHEIRVRGDQLVCTWPMLSQHKQ